MSGEHTRAANIWECLIQRQAMITPAVLISASGTLVLSTGNRLGRIVDRVRVLTAEA